jgi:hypothetical protein
LLIARLSLNSLLSLAATAGPMLTKNANGKLASPIAVLRFPALELSLGLGAY